jgi:hypothetical protein
LPKDIVIGRLPGALNFIGHKGPGFLEKSAVGLVDWLLWPMVVDHSLDGLGGGPSVVLLADCAAEPTVAFPVAKEERLTAALVGSQKVTRQLADFAVLLLLLGTRESVAKMAPQAKLWAQSTKRENGKSSG